MNKAFKYVLIILGIDVIVITVCWLVGDMGNWITIMLITPVLFLSFQALLGIMFMADKDTRTLGNAMLLAVGIILLIGIPICTVITMR